MEKSNSPGEYILPNGLSVFHLNKVETDFLYKEIFEEKSYVRNGITLTDKDVIVDVGANIGMFTLFISTLIKDFTVYAFEPIPSIFEVLKKNMSRFGQNVHVINSGISDREITSEFVFYPGMSVCSGKYADMASDKALLKDIVFQQYKNQLKDENLLNKFIDNFLSKQFNVEKQNCTLIPLSKVFEDYKLDKVDLLKIDAEKSEFEVIRGIGSYLKKIRQIVIEVHQPEKEILEKLEKDLIDEGFEVILEKEKAFSTVNVYNVYAVR